MSLCAPGLESKMKCTGIFQWFYIRNNRGKVLKKAIWKTLQFLLKYMTILCNNKVVCTYSKTNNTIKSLQGRIIKGGNQEWAWKYRSHDQAYLDLMKNLYWINTVNEKYTIPQTNMENRLRPTMSHKKGSFSLYSTKKKIIA